MQENLGTFNAYPKSQIPQAETAARLQNLKKEAFPDFFCVCVNNMQHRLRSKRNWSSFSIFNNLLTELLPVQMQGRPLLMLEGWKSISGIFPLPFTSRNPTGTALPSTEAWG